MRKKMERCNNTSCPISNNCHRWTHQSKDAVTFVPQEIADVCNKRKIKIICKHQIPKYLRVND